MSPPSYSPLEDKSENGSQSSEDYERLLSSDSEALFGKPSRKTPVWALIVLILVTSLCLIGFGVWIGSHWLTITSENAVCLEHVQKYCEFGGRARRPYKKLIFEKLRFRKRWTIHTMSLGSTVLFSRRTPSGSLQAQKLMRHGTL
jgi:hypothetical protein